MNTTMNLAMSMTRKELPPITISGLDVAASVMSSPAGDFLAREIARASVVPSGFLLPGVVTMGSRVDFRDETTGQARTVTLVYPEDADFAAGKLSVLSPVGAALIGLSVSQSIEWQTPSGGWRSLTVLRVG